MKKIHLSVVLATRNEEENIERCLSSVKGIADEIIVFDEHSSDKTKEIAVKFGARVFDVEHQDNFHITKQMAINKAQGTWILQLDADEAVSRQLREEIQEVLHSDNSKLIKNVVSNADNAVRRSDKKWRLFERHQRLIEEREGGLGKRTGEVVAFFVPRVNIFLGKPLIHAGVYPDGVIRLIKRGKARLPAKSVHELMEIEGEVGWLEGNLEHHDSPTLTRYIWRMNRYTDLHASDIEKNKVPKNVWGFLNYSFIKSGYTFCNLYFRHKGILDGTRGFLWSFFSALHFPLAYYKYWINSNKKL